MLCYKFIYVYLFYIQICFASQQRNDRGITFFSASEVVWQSFYHKIYDKVCMTKLYDKVIWHFCVFFSHTVVRLCSLFQKYIAKPIEIFFFCKGRLRVFILFYVLKVDFIVKSPTQYLNPLIPTVPKCHVSEKRKCHAWEKKMSRWAGWLGCWAGWRVREVAGKGRWWLTGYT